MKQKKIHKKSVLTILIILTILCASLATISYGNDKCLVTPESVGNIKLGDSAKAFPNYIKEINAVIEVATLDGEVPNDFYVQIERKESEFIFHLWHYSAFKEENCNMAGNPGGLCRDIVYDIEKQKVTKKLGWQ